jgi:radical SAM superfamily enzyme YgiQ (UPF0313 family)
MVADERGTLIRDAPIRVGLCYPNPYRVAMSSLGYQVIYRMFNSRPNLVAERIVLGDEAESGGRLKEPPRSLEHGRLLSDFHLLAFSVSFDLDIMGLFAQLEAAGIGVRRENRGPGAPPVLLGGPVTASNVLPFGPFIDMAVIGDGEDAVEALMDLLEGGLEGHELMAAAAEIPGVWVPEIHGDAVPATQKVTVGALPAYGQIITPHAELSNMFLVEASRGCPRFCKFCLVRATESPMREPELDAVMARIPDDAPRVGFVGAAVSEWGGIREAIRRVVETGRGIGVSSLRADRLDAEFVGLLARGGYRTMTVAADAPSQRLRNVMAKGIKTRHLVEAARLAQEAGMSRLKLYVIIGIPGETDEDMEELIGLCRELASFLPLALGVSPLVPKLHTPLGDAPFAGIEAITAKLSLLRRALGGVVDVRSASGKWAWIEYRMSQGGQDTGHAAYEAWKNGGRFAHFKAAFMETEERGALQAAARFGLFQAAGMR